MVSPFDFEPCCVGRVNAIVSDQLKALGGEKVGEEYIFFGSSDVAQAVEAIRKAKPDVPAAVLQYIRERNLYQPAHDPHSEPRQ
jgi:urea transport system substrate-binding protein